MAYFRCKGLARAKVVASFSVTSWTSLVGCAYWDAPSSMFDGVRIMYKTDSYPTSLTDGTLFYEGAGSSLQLTYDTTVTGATKDGFTNGTVYYFSCFSYYLVGGTKKYNTSQYLTAQWTALTISGSEPFSYTRSWTVPTGVRRITAYAVGGGGGGGYGAHEGYTVDNYHGGGGGAGAYRGTDSADVLPGQVIAVGIGSGGGSDGGGGTTTVGSFLSVGGGGGGNGEAGGGRGGSGGTGGGSGSGWTGSTSISGGQGGTNGGNGYGDRKGSGDGGTKYIGSTLFCGGGGGGGDALSGGKSGGAGGGANGGGRYNGGSSASGNTGAGGGGGGGAGSRTEGYWTTSGGSGGSGYAVINY